MIERFGHGGDLDTAAAEFGVAPESILDFSANINPLGPPEGLMERLRQELDAVIHYPDPDHRELRKLLAQRLGLDSSSICIGNGAAECMALAVLGLAPRHVGTVTPCFSEYAQLARQFGANVVAAQGGEENGFRAGTAELCDLLERTDLAFIGQPNNPTGLQYDMSTLEAVLERAEETDTYVVLDEAFIDFIPPERQATMLPKLPTYPHLIVIRSLTKFYAIPGLRLGFAAAHPETIGRMKRKQVTWSVNRLALAAGECCLAAGDAYERTTREHTAAERAFLIETLERDFGCRTWPSEANFILVRLPAPWTAERLQAELGRIGVLIRNCSMYEGLTAADIRIAVKDRKANERLIEAMKEVWPGGMRQ